MFKVQCAMCKVQGAKLEDAKGAKGDDEVEWEGGTGSAMMETTFLYLANIDCRIDL
jgi:hypothetical protein